MNLKDIQKRYIRAKYNFLGFDDWQVAEIVEGFLDGFNKKQISIYAQKCFNYNQIREIKSGLKEGLSIEQILLYAKPQFNHYQMRSIYQGLMNKLSEQEIQIFADEKYTYQQMNIIREGLEEGLSIEQVSTYANANFNIKKMKNIRNLLYLENNLPEEEKIILDSNDFWTVIYTKYPYNDEPQEIVRILNKELLEEIKNEIHAEVLAFEKHYDLFDSNEFYLAQFEHFVNHESVYTKNISNIEHVENTLENFKNLEEKLSKNEKIISKENSKAKEEEKEEKTILNFVEEELVKEFLEVYLDQDDTKWEKGFIAQLPINAKNGKEYSGLNQIRLQIYLLKNELDDPRFITFNQAKENNWSIKKGAKSIKICYRMPYDKSTNEPFNLEQVTNLSEGEKNQVLEEKVKWVLKYYNVFHAKDVEGIPAYETPSNLNFEDTSLQIDFIRNCIKGMQLHYRESPNIEAASYNMIEDRIMMPNKNQFESEGAYFATILHELGHATGHEKRLNRNLDPDSSTEEYIMEELVAELNSLFMQSNIKLSKYIDKENSFSYLKNWLSQSKNKPEVIMGAIKEAVKAKNYLLDAGKYNELFQEKESIDLKQPQTFLFARGVEDEVVIYEMNEENFNKVMKKASMLNNENSKIELAHFDNEGNPIYSQLLDSGLTSYDSFKNKKSDLKFQTAINLSWKNEIENYFKKEIHLEELLQKEKQEEILNQKTEKNDNRKRYDSRSLELLKKISIIQYATEALGWNPKKVGKNTVSFAQHDSLIVFENTNTYSQYSKGEGGSIIDFIKNIEKLEMNDAIKKLQDYYSQNSKNINFKISTIEEIKESDSGLNIPERNKTNRNAIDYLQKRGIGSEVISDYIDQELIYQDKKWNCCFVGKDINNKVHEVNLRSTFDNSNFKGKASGSHPIGTMKYAKKIETLFIAEAVIDAMSYDTMNPNSRNNTSYLSTNGVNNIQQILEKRKDEIQKFNKIILGFDNDDAGRNAIEETKKYFESFYPEKEIGIIIPNQKDFNDDLKTLKNNEIEKAVDLKLGKSDVLSLGRN